MPHLISGAVQREGRLHIQLTYARSFSALLPHIALRNSERFLLRQVYCCLVQCDKNGVISPQLAHHWVYNAELQRWRFYLRPALTFHDGSTINADKIAELFNRLKRLATYKTELAHVIHISAINPLCIDFQLDQPDPGFAGLVADVKYSIQPYSQLNATTAIVGSGAFKVQEHTQQRHHKSVLRVSGKYRQTWYIKPVRSVQIMQLAALSETLTVLNRKIALSKKSAVFNRGLQVMIRPLKAIKKAE
ncbi:ABC transporter substrate-binding protein [Moritella viscosa]